MARVVVVHGILKQYASRADIAADLETPLLGGVDNATKRRDLLRSSDVEYVFYGDIFRPSGKRLAAGVPPYTAEDVTDPYEQELLLAWWQAAAATDPQVTPPDAPTLGVRTKIQRALNALASCQFLAEALENELIFLLRQVRLYFTDPAIREKIQQCFATAVGPDTRVVVAHSLGSVVAYEALCAPDPSWHIPTLLTLGSPLGVRGLVFDRLLPPPQARPPRRGVRPPGLQAWTNLADTNDIVALEKKLGDVFEGEIVDYQVHNGVRVHSAARYLTTPEAGAAIAAGL